MNRENEEQILINPEDILKFLEGDKALLEEKAAKTKEFLNALPASEMIEQLKQVVYRNIQLLSVMNQNYNSLSTSEKLMLENLEHLFYAVVHSLKWIALHNELDYTTPFGDSLLVQKIGDITFGRPIMTLEDIPTKPVEETNDSTTNSVFSFRGKAA